MAWYRCSAATGTEIHGAKIVVICGDEYAIGETITLKKSDNTVVATKTLTSSTTVLFDKILEPDVYQIFITVSGIEYSETAQITADDVVYSRLIECTIETRNYIYNSGDEYTDKTGGWVIGNAGYVSGDTSFPIGTSAVKNSDNILLNPNHTQAYPPYQRYIFTANKIGLSPDNKIKLLVQYANNGTSGGDIHVRFANAISANSYNASNMVDNIRVYTSSTNEDREIEFTADNVPNGAFHIVVSAYRMAKLNIKKIWIE